MLKFSNSLRLSQANNDLKGPCSALNIVDAMPQFILACLVPNSNFAWKNGETNTSTDLASSFPLFLWSPLNRDLWEEGGDCGREKEGQ